MPAEKHPAYRLPKQICRRCGVPFDELAPLDCGFEPKGWAFGYGRCPACWARLGPPPAADSRPTGRVA